MNDEQIYDEVEKKVDRMVSEVYYGIQLPIDIKPIVMNFVTKAITRTLIAKNEQIKTCGRGGD